MLTGWVTLLQATLGEGAFDADILRVAIMLLVFSILGIFFQLADARSLDV